MYKRQAVNYKRGLVAFKIENGDCGYFEVLDTVEFEKEDKIKGNLESLGGEKIIKIDSNILLITQLYVIP